VSRIRIALAALALVAVVGVVFVASAFAASKPALVKKASVTTTTITVKAKEFHFTLSKTSIPKPGKVVFKVTNVGKEPHNFVFLSGINKGTALILPGKAKSVTITFKKKGKYTYECTVGEHAAEGMLGTFTVK
jgi:plastocyanin